MSNISANFEWPYLTSCVSPSSPLGKEVGRDNGPLDFTLYDAVLTNDADSTVDPEMEKFIPLLREYLTRTFSTPNLTLIDTP